jgi:hypothetical protein
MLGRWQTRLFSVIFVGGIWTAAITPLLPSRPLPPDASRLAGLYVVTMSAVGLIAALGVVLWEPLWHLLQQFRWEKDWPPVFFLLQAVPEGAVVHWVLGRLISGGILGWPWYLLDFGTTWLVIFAVIHGPMRVVFLRWRFRGGRIL